MRLNCLILVLLATASQLVSSWPNGNFTYRVPFAPGGGSAGIAETQSRYIPQAKLLYKSINSGATAWADMKNDPKDGSIITLINLPHIYIQPYVPELRANYTPDDIAIAYIHTYTPLVLLVPKHNSTILTWSDFVAACKTRHITVSGAGTGTVFETGSGRLRQLARIKFDYLSAGTGATTAITEMLKGKYDAAWTTTPVVKDRTDVRVLAIASEYEFPTIDAPTFRTLGINYIDGIYRGVGLPAGTPESVMKEVSNYFNALNRNKTFIAEVQADNGALMFMPYDSPSLNYFTATYRKSIYNVLFPTDPISRGSIYAFFAFGGLGILLCLASAIFSFIFRNTPVIKGSSYFFNNIIIFGIVLAYASVIVTSLQMPLKGVTERTLSAGCKALPWLLGLGFDITFSAIIVKSYRLYRLFLFTASKIVQFDASNLAILKWVFGICGINAIVYLVWTVQDPLSAELLSMDGDDTFYYSCTSENASAYLGVVLLLKYIMLCCCIFFSVKLRDLNAMLNETKAIAAATFSTTFVLTVCLAVYALVSSFEGRYIILVGGTTVGATTCLGALFLPKVMVALFNPDANTFDYIRRVVKGSDLSRGASSGGEGAARSGSIDARSTGRGSMDLFTSNPVLLHPPQSTISNSSMTPIYVQEGRAFNREHRDRINALARVICNTASEGRVSEFQNHVGKLAQFASRIRVMATAKSRAFSIPSIKSGEQIAEDVDEP
ncbi:uncharacterized protein SPPG_00031 [Spizellomyces punctatus DAOM BR117]|uniref:G-protein coupled receptors family 3 profile domain-containing protein n=1 Tax=Spizellomyces punctatus (strain DAOM BR117) TaxID=645134 RepID=A0A0L0HT55_SPIPD|nr:uncharacterized protein SPPG_00031 [Spizellomyces punctatus DAOM BR117]KND04298.1 hypothetical protein SPPG_00031 [Spizellomyces punctatus DAOM BR117]|eukprot:XP_016612337.1 hypothetical protein SPPG_00031 [Spizellomyces punctatus DAOM BR117]